MTEPYAGFPTYHANIPLVEDGDNRSAAPIAAGEEALTDRTSWLREVCVGATSGLGISRIRFYPTQIEAVAATDYSENTVVQIGNKGMYIYHSLSQVGELDDAPFRYAVTSGGYLYWASVGIAAKSSGLASVSEDGSAFGTLTTPDIVPYRTVYQNSMISAVDDYVSSYWVLMSNTTWQVFGGTPEMSDELPNLQEGDLVIASATFPHQMIPHTGSTASVRYKIDVGGFTMASYNGDVTPNSGTASVALSGRFVCPDGGLTAPEIRLLGKLSHASDQVVLWGSVCLNVQVIRP